MWGKQVSFRGGEGPQRALGQPIFNRDLQGVLKRALSNPAFAAHWHASSDAGFRPFAAAVLLLAPGYRDPEASAMLGGWIVTVKRHELLRVASGMEVSPGLVRLLPKVEWPTMTAADWRHLITSCRRADLRKGLGHARRITPDLLRQLDHLPAVLMFPRILDVLCDLRLPQSWWRCLDRALQDAVDPIWALGAAGRIATAGDFWDFYFACLYGRGALTDPPSGLRSAMLKPLVRLDDLTAEALTMRNCLMQRAADVRLGSAVLFRGLDPLPPLTAELCWDKTGWRPGMALGPANMPLSPAVWGLVQAELHRLARRMPTRPPVRARQAEREALRLRHWARQRYDMLDITALSQTLERLLGADWGARNPAFAVFEGQDGAYVQVMPCQDRPAFLCEVSSHKFQPALIGRLTVRAVACLDRLGFLWPQGMGNFVRSFAAENRADCMALAELILAVMGRIFGHPTGCGLRIDTRIPSVAGG